MKKIKNEHFPYSILHADIICEHKLAQIDRFSVETMHDHDGYEILLFLSGEANIIVESEEKRLEPGDLLVIPPYTVHSIRVKNMDQYERIVLNFHTGILEQLGDQETDFISFFSPLDKNYFRLISLPDNHVDEMVELLHALISSLHKKQFGQSVLSRAYLTEFLVKIAGYTHKYSTTKYEDIMPPIVKRTISFIEENLYNELSVEIIAQSLHHNSDYLGRVFKNSTGGSLKYFINAKKIGTAQQLLSEGHPPYDVCFMLCFNNYSSFSRCFSQHIGLSPKQFVMSLRK